MIKIELKISNDENNREVHFNGWDIPYEEFLEELHRDYDNDIIYYFKSILHEISEDVYFYKSRLEYLIND